MEEERWLPVVGHEGKYEVSDHGHVRSLDRIIMYKKGSTIYPARKRGCVLRPGPVGNGFGHLTVVLGRRTNGGSGSKTVHSIVMEAFVGPRPAGYDIAHKDGNVNNNTLKNLRYATRSENNYDCSERDGFRIKRAVVAEIHANRYINAKILAERLGVSESYVNRVRYKDLRLHG